MIKYLELKNFQGHVASSLNFVPGVNIIKGTSHNGKSSIIRALKWALQNRPLGEAFRNWDAPEDAEVKVALQFDDGVVIRKRDGKFNGYIVDGLELEALGRDLPEEVTNITRMDETNCQFQHDSFFFLQDTPGNVAKRLNEATNLTVIDETLTRTNQEINRISSDTKLAQKVIKQAEEDLKQYGHVEQAGKEVDSLIRTHKTLTETADQRGTLTSLCSDLKDAQNSISEAKDWLTIEKPYLNLVSTLKSYQETVETLSSVNAIMDSLGELNRKIELQSVLIESESEVNRLLGIREQLKDNYEKRTDLYELVSSIDALDARKEPRELVLGKLEKKKKDLVSQIKVCPTCGTTLIKDKS